jgi:thioredoxin-like negative regulator of GroEL
VVEQASDSLKGKIDVYYVDAGKVPEIINKYKVRNMPAMILFKDGEPIDRMSGFHSEEEVHNFLTQ